MNPSPYRALFCCEIRCLAPAPSLIYVKHNVIVLHGHIKINKLKVGDSLQRLYASSFLGEVPDVLRSDWFQLQAPRTADNFWLTQSSVIRNTLRRATRSLMWT